MVTTDFSSSAGAAATRQLLSSKSPPTAIVYDNDIMAVAGLGTAQEMGVLVPAELSLVSFDDSTLCEVVRPALTARARDVVAYGARAAQALIALVEGEADPRQRGRDAEAHLQGQHSPLGGKCDRRRPGRAARSLSSPTRFTSEARKPKAFLNS